MKAIPALRTAAGLLAFAGGWVLAVLAGIRFGDYWIWLGVLFGWVPAILLANFAERLWPVMVILLTGIVWMALTY